MKFKRFIENEEVSSNGEPPTEITISNGVAEKDPAAIESIRMDVELFIRVMEYARENAKTDQELHELTERAAVGSRDKILTMADYEALVQELRRGPDDPNAEPYPASKLDPATDAGKPTDPQSFGGQALSGS
jgi:hypothetical protein